jgi:hypothetical protein
MRIMKALVIVAATAAVIAVGMPDANAQCGAGPRPFASIGGGMNVPAARFDATASANAGNIGRFWTSVNSDDGNNWGFTELGVPNLEPNKDSRNPAFGRCSSLGWWQVALTTLRGFNGVIGAVGCEAVTCPGGDLSFAVEEYGPGGPPGINGTAYFGAWRTDRDPTGGGINRQWDLSVPSGAGTFLLQEFPKVQATDSSKVGNDTQVVANFGTTDGAATDAGASVWVNNGSILVDTGVLKSIDILEAAAPADPGRERFNGVWVEKASITYNNAAVGGVVHTVDCGDRTEDVYVALGLTFEGGGGAKDVKSLLVGQAVLVQCDPTIAKPDSPIRPGARPRDVQPRGGEPSRTRSGR